MMPLFAFLDEAGEYTFRAQAGSFLIYTGVITERPALFSHELAALKYELLAGGHCIERFHASEDKQFVRDRVFDIIGASRDFVIHSIIVRKNRINPSLYKHGVYSVAYRTMLKYLVGGSTKADRYHFIVDTVPDKQQQTTLKDLLKLRAAEAMGQTPFSIDHHNSSAHALLQVADYCAWATHKKWQSKSRDLRPYSRIAARVRNEFDLYGKSNIEYY